jgi:pyruvate dehydrogenase E1 component beta subunit
MSTREITYLEAVREAMVQEMRRDQNVFFLGEDIGTYGGAFGVSKGMLEEFGPERVLDTRSLKQPLPVFPPVRP